MTDDIGETVVRFTPSDIEALLTVLEPTDSTPANVAIYEKVKAAQVGIEWDHLRYLDNLREKGVTNMMGAAPYLVMEFGISKTKATEVLQYWMLTFDDRQRANV